MMACNLTTGEVEYIDKTIADLKTENDKLVMKLNAEHIVRQNVERENDKLRELVRDVMPIVCNGCHERLCEMPKEEHPFVTCSFEDRMRELGVDA